MSLGFPRPNADVLKKQGARGRRKRTPAPGLLMYAACHGKPFDVTW